MPAWSSTSPNDGDCRDSNGRGAIRIDPHRLEALDQDECILRLHAHEVGRIGASPKGRRIAYPAMCTVHEGVVIICTRAGGDIRQATDDELSALEIDDAGSLSHDGSSVLGVRRASHVSDLAELARLKLVRFSPEADKNRYNVARSPSAEVNERRLRHRTPVSTGHISPPGDRQRADFSSRAAADGERWRV
jgi:hypothetical protein